MKERHRRIAEIALSVGGRFSLALAGGYAIEAHGIGSRPSGDVDLFLDWDRRGAFDDTVDAVIGALKVAGMDIDVIGPVLHVDDAVANKMAASTAGPCPCWPAPWER